MKNRTRLEIPPGVISRRSRSPSSASGATASETANRVGVHDLDDLGRHARAGDPHAAGVLEILAVDRGLDRLSPLRSGRKHEGDDRLRRLGLRELRCRRRRREHQRSETRRAAGSREMRAARLGRDSYRIGLRSGGFEWCTVHVRRMYGSWLRRQSCRRGILCPASTSGVAATSDDVRVATSYGTAGGGSFSPAIAFLTNSGFCSDGRDLVGRRGQVGRSPLHRAQRAGGEVAGGGDDQPLLRARSDLHERGQQPVLARVPELDRAVGAGGGQRGAVRRSAPRRRPNRCAR